MFKRKDQNLSSAVTFCAHFYLADDCYQLKSDSDYPALGRVKCLDFCYRDKIEEMVEMSKVKCRRDYLWQRMSAVAKDEGKKKGKQTEESLEPVSCLYYQIYIIHTIDFCDDKDVVGIFHVLSFKTGFLQFITR